MKNARMALLLLVSIGIGAGLVHWYDKRYPPICPPCKADVVIMRTNGGLLEVTTLQKVETFTSNWVFQVLGVPVGHTTSQIQVPAHYTYRIKLAPEWRVLRTGKVFTVMTPPFEPALPVAVDFGQMKQFTGGTWVLAQFNSANQTQKLQQGISAELARRARDPKYVQLQRAAARKTVEEFVRKWLLTQTVWQTERNAEVQVLFADEPASKFAAIYSH